MRMFLKCYPLIAFFLLGNLALAQDAGLNLANTEITKLGQEKNYTPTDISTSIISDDYVSGGIRHIYYQQSIEGIGIYGTNASVHLKDGEIISSNLSFLPQLEKRDIQTQFQVQALEAVARLAVSKGYPLSQTELLVLEADDQSPAQSTTVSTAGISNRTIPMKLVYFVNGQEQIELAWNLFIDEVESAAYKNYLIGTATGDILLEEDLTVYCSFDQEHDHDHDHTSHNLNHQNTADSKSESMASEAKVVATDSTYHVLKYNIESPNFGTRIMEVKPWENNIASPNGWHSMFGIDYQYTIGNNVDAYSDRDNSNDPTGENDARAFGGPTLTFDQPWDVNGTPLDYTKAAITNLFYMNNVAHDIFYNYGFDEVSGNFQEDNFNKGGIGSDNVAAEAQDPSRSCNANMATPADGANPRMQMGLCTNSDGSFDNAVILHEFGHGVSNRLTGGPNEVACLGNVEQMGEGWSDFFGMVMSMKPADVATTNRTIGTFLFNQDENGVGLRKYPYTTDMNVNPITYDSINASGFTRPHGVGAVWATMLWDLNWALINQYGWNADLYDSASTLNNGAGGNNIAFRLVMEGLKIQPCSPGFVDGRDAILAADLALYGGVNRCLIWEVFARRGLGYSADQGSSNSRADGTEGYDMPPECTIELLHTVDRSAAYLGERITFQLTAVNHLDAIAPNVIITDTLPDNVQFYSASDGAVVNGNIVEWPAFNLPPNGSKVVELVVQMNDAIVYEEDFLDDMEGGGDNWKVLQPSKNHAWNLQSQYYFSPSNGWFVANAGFASETHLVLKDAVALTDTSELSFNHLFDLESTYDFGLVEISIDGGITWIDLENNFTQNGYNNYTKFGRNAFSNKSIDITPNNMGFITSIADLSPYADEVAIIRFRIISDLNSSNFGWIVDDIGLSNTNYALPNFGNIRNNEYNFDTQVKTPVVINQSQVNHTVETATDTLMIFNNSAAVFVDVQANDIDADGALDTLLTTILTTTSNGTAMVVNNDSISYEPDGIFFGRDTLIYQVCDELNACESDTLFLFIEEFTNEAPVTMEDFLEINKNTTASFINVLENDSDPDGVADTLTTSILEGALHGVSTVINADSISYTPNTDFIGLDTIVYQACDTSNTCVSDTIFITVNDFNEGPTANPDDVRVVENSTDNLIGVQANDTDPNGVGDSLLTTIVEIANNGTSIVVNGDSINYTPTTDYFGLDTIIYQVCDTANLCDIDTVFIEVLEENLAPIATADYVTIDQNSQNIYIDVQSNDYDPNGVDDILITKIIAGAFYGTVGIVDNDSLIYTPTTNYFGQDTIIYGVCDTSGSCAIDTVFITINEVLFCTSENLVKNENGVVDGSYVAANTITSEGVIPDTANVKFVAGTEIILLPGFHAKVGSNFIAMIDDCDNGGPLTDDIETQRTLNTPNILLEQPPIAQENNLVVRPNPFRYTAIIDYELGRNSRVWIGLHDVTGKVIHVFVNQQEMPKGQYQYSLSAANLTSGAYWISMRTADSILTKKIIILQE